MKYWRKWGPVMIPLMTLATIEARWYWNGRNNIPLVVPKLPGVRKRREGRITTLTRKTPRLAKTEMA